MLATRGTVVRGHSLRGIAEEAPGAYKDVAAVVDAADDGWTVPQGGSSRAACVHQGLIVTTH
jgi:RNA-splicing ligase RtcB